MQKLIFVLGLATGLAFMVGLAVFTIRKGNQRRKSGKTFPGWGMMVIGVLIVAGAVILAVNLWNGYYPANPYIGKWDVFGIVKWHFRNNGRLKETIHRDDETRTTIMRYTTMQNGVIVHHPGKGDLICVYEERIARPERLVCPTLQIERANRIAWEWVPLLFLIIALLVFFWNRWEAFKERKAIEKELER